MVWHQEIVLENALLPAYAYFWRCTMAEQPIAAADTTKGDDRSSHGLVNILLFGFSRSRTKWLQTRIRAKTKPFCLCVLSHSYRKGSAITTEPAASILADSYIQGKHLD